MTLNQHSGDRSRVGQITGLLSPQVQKFRLGAVTQHLQGPRVLDFGCGTGDLVPYLPEDVQYVGIDRDLPSVARARAWFPDREFHHLTGELDLSHLGTFDTVVMAAVLEHLPDPIRVLSLLAKHALVPGRGRVVATTPHPRSALVLSLGVKLRLLSHEAHDEHETLLSFQDLVRIAQQSGLRVVTYKTFLCGLNQVAVMES